jgi:hypothetical protein
MYEIYSIGNATFLIEVFRGIARLWSTGDIYLMLSIALLLGLIWNSLMWAIDQDKAPFPAKGFILSIVFVLAFLGPQSLVDVRITSKRDASFQEVNNVPLLPALGGWLITNSGTAIADLMAQAFSIVGIANTWEALSPIQNFVALDDANFSSACTPISGDPSYNVCNTLHKYIEDCYETTNIIAKNAAQPIEALTNAAPRDIMAALKVTSPKFTTTSYLVSNNPDGEVLTCPAVWSKLNTVLNNSTFKTNLQKTLSSEGVDLDAVTKFLSQAAQQGVVPSAESSFDLANVAFLKSVFADYFPHSKYGQQVSRAMFDTVRQRQLANAGKKEYWMENAEVMQSFFEALTVFLVPFLGLVLAISGHGIMAMGQYFAAWAFVQLWSVMIVLVNLFTALAMTNRFTDAVVAGKSQFSLSAIDSQFATANSYISISGMMYTFIPAICVFVLYRGVHSMQGMAKQAMADPNINAQRLSPDTGATVSNGRVPFGNNTGVLQNQTGDWQTSDTLTASSMGKFTVAESTGNGLTAGATDLKSAANGSTASASKALDNVFGDANTSSMDFTDGKSTTYNASNIKEATAGVTKALVDATGMTTQQAEQLMANGDVTMTAGGGFQLGAKAGKNGTDEDGRVSSAAPTGMFAGFGAKFNADIKAAVGVNSKTAQGTSDSYQEALQKANANSEKVNANLSRIHTGSEVLSASNNQGIQQAAKEAAAYTRQAQALEQQSAMLSQLSTSSSQLGQSKEIDMVGAGHHLKNQSIADFMQSQEPEAWDRIKNSTIDGMSGDKWLQQREDKNFAERGLHTDNPRGDARALALMDLVKQNNSIDLTANGQGGVDIAKEKQDTQTNKDIFKALSSVGIANAGAAAEFYDKKDTTLSNMENTNTEIEQTKGSIGAGAPTIASAQEFNQEHQNRQDAVRTGVDSGAANAKQGQVEAEQAQKDDMARFKSESEELTGGKLPDISPSKSDELSKKSDHLNRNVDSISKVLDVVSNSTNAVGEVLKPGGANAYNNFVENQTQAKADTSNLRPEYSQGVESSSQLTAVETGSMNDRLTSKDADKVKNAQSMIAVWNDDTLMTQILGKDENGKYGKGTDESKKNFDTNTLQSLSDGANWLDDYKTSGEHLKAIDQGIALADTNAANSDGARAYLGAMQHLGIAQEASEESDGKVFSSISVQAASDLTSVLDKQAANGNTSNLMAEVTGNRDMTSGSIWMPAGDREATRDDYSNKLDTMETLASRMDHLLNDGQKQFVKDFIQGSRDRINEDVGDRPNEQMGGDKDEYLKAAEQIFTGGSSSQAGSNTDMNTINSSDSNAAVSSQTASNADVNTTNSIDSSTAVSSQTASNADVNTTNSIDSSTTPSSQTVSNADLDGRTASVQTVNSSSDNTVTNINVAQTFNNPEVNTATNTNAPQAPNKSEKSQGSDEDSTSKTENQDNSAETIADSPKQLDSYYSMSNSVVGGRL